MVRIEKLKPLLWIVHLEDQESIEKIDNGMFQAITSDPDLKISNRKNLTEKSILVTLTKKKTIKSMPCPKCGQQNKPETVYCGKCSFRLREES